jgi:Zn finger protein HypA/HybF involved in hydrogenase expression
MYTRQILGAILLGMTLTVTTWISGADPTPAIALGLLATFGIRWLWATFLRIQYWHSRDSRDLYTEYCPNCHAKRYRTSGDWLLTCHRCGWQPGLPVLRWFTRSLPATQLRRSVPRLGAFAAGVLVTILIYTFSPVGLTFPTTIPSVTLPDANEVANTVGVFLAVSTILLVVYIYLRYFRPWYCDNCGQFLGRGRRPNRCGRCDSNRMTNRKTPAGQKVVIQNDDK